MMHAKTLEAFRQLKRYAQSQKCARELYTCTYGELGRVVGMSHRRVGQPLYDVQDACQELVVPPITGLVVLASTGLPSTGFKGAPGRTAHRAVLRQIYDFDWTPITDEVIVDAWKRFNGRGM